MTDSGALDPRPFDLWFIALFIVPCASNHSAPLQYARVFLLAMFTPVFLIHEYVPHFTPYPVLKHSCLSVPDESGQTLEVSGWHRMAYGRLVNKTWKPLLIKLNIERLDLLNYFKREGVTIGLLPHSIDFPK